MEYLIAHIGHTGKHCEHVTWWNPGRAGYTVCIDRAGKYSETEARELGRYGESIAVPVAVVESLARSIPYYRKLDGMLARLYDGGACRPVENSARVWKQLLGQRLVGRAEPRKPTPIPVVKTRAIYLDAPAAATAQDVPGSVV